MRQLINLYKKKLERTNTAFLRYLYKEIDWRSRLIIIKGAKGVGKTTLILQHIKLDFPDPDKALYVSLDHVFFATHSLLDIAEYASTHGITHLFFDEVHKYENWEQEVKNIYDFYDDLSIVATGSSMLQIEKAKVDLSRRHIMYEMCGLSFREYLAMEKVIDFDPITLEELLSSHSKIAMAFAMKIKVLPHFEKYLQSGYYPFYREIGGSFEERVLHTIDSTISEEIPAVSNIEYSTTYKLKRFLGLLADTPPFTLNVTDLSNQLDTSRNSVLLCMDLLDKAGIIRKLYARDHMSSLAKPEKILFNNSNIMYAFGKTKIGTVRESFFASVVSQAHKILMPTKGDFLVDGKWTFEVGGPNKGFEQIKNVPDSYVVADEIEIGAYNTIPLWMFGLLY
ncbi:MAG: AAA family ATPase [Bacteroidales bacterium]|nr:AAA family ATPase [Bacteroidales bacterium]MCD8395349.1 AAA family ATPase [Bacteroidales bacterium]